MSKFTVITVCKNMDKELEKTIKSVQSQKCKDYEYLIIDGNSTDKTMQVLKKYSGFIDKYISEPDTGIFSAMNKGIKISRGDYIYFLNAGDTFSSEQTLCKVAEHLTNNQSDLVYGNVWMWEYANHWLTKFNNINRWFLIQNSICHQALFTHRKVFVNFGLFDEQYQIAGDYDWFASVWLNNKIKKQYVNIDIANFELSGKSSSQKYRSLVLSECEAVRRKYFNALEIFIYHLYKWLGEIKQNI